VDLDVRPEPAPGDEAALQAAFEELESDPWSKGRSTWWQEGVRENLDEPEPDEL
jgi:hypothetical protein